jgi:UDP-galactose transporter B1
VSQVFAKAFTYLSLAAGVSFPVVVLAKSAKIVPVMLGQLILGKSQYGFRDYMFALLIVCETVLLSGGETALTPGSSTIGLLLIAASLVMDGVTAGLQKRILNNTKNAPLTSFDFLLFTNFSMVTVAVVISVLTGDFVNGWQFIQNNPAALKLLLKCCLFSAVGQSFIYYVVATFDPLVCSTITTTRKIFSVLLSIIFKGHILNDRGRAGLVFALAGLAIEIEHKLSSTQRHKNNNKDLGTVSSSNLSDSMSSDSPFVRSQRCVRQRTASPGGAES